MATSTTIAGYPDATNTGVPAGTTLTPSGDLIITQAGTVLSGLNITGTVTVEAANVTIENCSITGATPGGVIQINSGIEGTTVQNCTINGTGANNPGSSGIVGGGTFIGNNIYNVENGFAITDTATVQNNYIHNLVASGSPHYDGIQIDGGVSNVTISHNTIINANDWTSAVMIDNGFGAISNISVDNNILAGGGYTVYDDAHFDSSPITGVSFTNNHIQSGFYGDTDFNGTNPTYTGNVDDGAALVANLNTAANDSASTSVSSSTTGSTSSTGSTGSTSSTGSAGTSGSSPTAGSGSTSGSASATGSSSGSSSTTGSGSTGGSSPAAGSSSTSGSTSSADLAAPVITTDKIVNTDHVRASGTAEADSTITVHDGTTVVGTTTTGANGHWHLTTSALPAGDNVLTATATDTAGHVSAASAPFDPVVGSSASGATGSTSTTSAGSSTGSSAGSTSTTTTSTSPTTSASGGDSHGHWAHHAGSGSGAAHTQATDSGVAGAGSTATGTNSGSSSTAPSGAGQPDTFVFAANFGNHVIKDFTASGSNHDTIQFSASEFANFASVLSHASQVGHDVVISTGHDSLTLKDVKLGALNAHDFHFA